MTWRRSALIAGPAVWLLLASISSCTSLRPRDLTSAGAVRNEELLLPPPAPPESYIGSQLCRA